MNNYTGHQFSLFGFVAPKRKVPISKAKVLLAKKFIEERNSFGAVRALRSLREDLERFERTL